MRMRISNAKRRSSPIFGEGRNDRLGSAPTSTNSRPLGSAPTEGGGDGSSTGRLGATGCATSRVAVSGGSSIVLTVHASRSAHASDERARTITGAYFVP
jgi:hypothetical protein